MSPPPSVEVQHLTKRFGSFVALHEANFRFEGVGAIGYLGPNGAGKTTSMKLLTRLLRPSQGRSFLNGHDVLDATKEALWDVGAVVESPEPYPQQTGREALEMVAEFRGLGRERRNDQIARYAQLLELPPLERRSGQLSKGQRQRIVLASAFLSEPSVLLLDEPTSGLDPAERVILRRLFLEKKRTTLLLMSSHLLAEVTDVCDRVIFVNQGRIALEDTIDGIAARFRSRQIDVEFTRPMPEERWPSLGSLAAAVHALGGARYRIDFDGTEKSQTELLLACQKLGTVLSYGSSTLGLEDAYLALLAPGAAGPPAAPSPRPPPAP
ncbi:MAG: ABC transporter ATP-binding protein [Thermoplasmata archaeon]